jgi:hypothetical protein
MGFTPITVIEDDIVVPHAEKVSSVWPEAFKQLPPGEAWGMLYPGGCFNFHHPVTHGQYLAKTQGGRCAHAYVISALGSWLPFKEWQEGRIRQLIITIT